VNYILYFLLITLTTYNDSFLSNSLGAFGFSLLPVMSFLLFLLMCLFRKRITYPIFVKKFGRLINYTFVLSIVVLVVFFSLNLPTTLYGENVALKILKLYITFVSYILFMIVLGELMKSLSMKQLLAPFWWINLSLAIYGIVEYTKIPNAFLYLHSNQEIYWRVRLLCQESSHSAPIIEIFFILALYYSVIVKKSRFYSIIAIGCLLSQICISSSKSLLVVLILAITFAGWSYIKNISGTKKIVGLIVALIGFVFIQKYLLTGLLESFSGDLENSTSTVTRSSTNIAGYIIGVFFPFGTGFFGYLYFFPKVLLYLSQNVPSDYNIDELLNIIMSDTDAGVSAQSFFSQSSTYWGLVGSVLFFKYIKKVYSNCLIYCDFRQRLLYKVLFFIVVLHLLTTSNMEFIFLVTFCLMMKHTSDFSKNEVTGMINL